MSFTIECDEGFETSVNIASKQSVHNFQKQKDTKLEGTEKSEINECKQCHRLKSQNNDLSEENLNLKELNKELYEMDQKRQRYDVERQDYILRLLRTIKRLQLRSSRMISESESDCQSVHERQKSVHKSETKDNGNSQSLLQQSYESALKENVNLQKELEDLRTNFDNLIEELSKIESEHIQVLQFQAKVHKEDFECERRDKDNALNQLKQMASEKDRLNTICSDYEKKLQTFVQLFQSASQLPNKGVKQSSSLTKVGVKEETNKTNSLPNDFRHKTNIIQNNSQSNSEIYKSDELIECPNCRIHFPIQFHEQLLQHFERCQRNI